MHISTLGQGSSSVFGCSFSASFNIKILNHNYAKCSKQGGPFCITLLTYPELCDEPLLSLCAQPNMMEAGDRCAKFTG